MKYRILGKTELKISVIGLDTDQFYGECLNANMVVRRVIANNKIPIPR